MILWTTFKETYSLIHTYIFFIILDQKSNPKKTEKKKVNSPTLKDELRGKHAKERNDRIRTIDRDEHLAGHEVRRENAAENGNI